MSKYLFFIAFLLMLSCQEDVKTEVKSVDVPCDEKADDFLKQKPQEISLEAPADAGCSIE